MYSFCYLESVCCSMSNSKCCFLTCIQISQEAGQVVWYSQLFQNFHRSLWSTQAKVDWFDLLAVQGTLNSLLQHHSSKKECSNYRTVALILRTSKVMLKILQARLRQYVNCKIPDVQAGFRKGRRIRDQIANIAGSWKKQESSRKTSISALLTIPKPLTMWITINCGKF